MGDYHSQSRSDVAMVQKEKAKKKPEQPLTRVCTINIHKRIHKVGFKRRAPRAVTEIRKFAKDMMKTDDVRIDEALNKFMWNKGIRNVHYRVRVKLSKKRNENEDATDKFYTVVTHVPVAGNFKGLLTQTVDE